MEALSQGCCGLDVHKRTVAACLRRSGPQATRPEEIRPGTRKSGRRRHGNRWLRATLIECARGAVRARDS